MFRTIFRSAAVVLGVLVSAQSALASFHVMEIEQVIGGINGDTTAQAIQLRTRGAGQNLISQGRINVRDAAGANPVLIVDFTTNNCNGSTCSPSTDRPILVASAAFLAQTSPAGVADVAMTNLIPSSYLAAGSLTFEDDFGTIYWRLSWGGSGYTGSGSESLTNEGVPADGSANPPFASALPSTNLTALKYNFPSSQGSTNNAAQYVISASPSVWQRNNLTTYTVSPPVTGACCNATNGMCSDGVNESSCMPPLQFTASMLCADVTCVPTMSEWGLIVTCLLVLCAGTYIVRRRMSLAS